MAILPDDRLRVYKVMKPEIYWGRIEKKSLTRRLMDWVLQ